ncbi:MAG: transcriptional repressor [Lentisphaeria bacterium]|nr:transcriptional repressor [Lentisphaeria bacterium]
MNFDCTTRPVQRILADAEEYCQRAALRLTEGRRHILAVVAGSERAVKAYDLLNAVTDPGKKVMPPTVYRALDFWITHGFIHRIESLNAFIACDHPLRSHGCQMLICTDCGRVIEVCQAELRDHFRETAAANGFLYDHSVLEIYGRCPDCQSM